MPVPPSTGFFLWTIEQLFQRLSTEYPVDNFGDKKFFTQNVQPVCEYAQ